MTLEYLCVLSAVWYSIEYLNTSVEMTFHQMRNQKYAFLRSNTAVTGKSLKVFSFKYPESSSRVDINLLADDCSTIFYFRKNKKIVMSWNALTKNLFLSSRRKSNFQKKHKCKNFPLSLGRNRGLRACDVFGFVNPYTLPRVVVQIKKSTHF